MREPKKLTKSFGFRVFNGKRYSGLGIASTIEGARKMGKDAKKDGYSYRVTAVRVPNGSGHGTHIAYLFWARKE